MLVVLAAAAVPFIRTGLLAAKVLLTEHDINYYLDARPPEFWLSTSIGTGLAIVAAVTLALVSVPLIFVLPHALFNNASIRSAFRDSRLMARSVGSWRIAGCILTWFATWSVASLVLNAAIHLVGRVLVKAAGDNVALLLAALEGIAAVSFIVNFLIVFGAVSIGCLASKSRYPITEAGLLKLIERLISHCERDLGLKDGVRCAMRDSTSTDGHDCWCFVVEYEREIEPTYRRSIIHIDKELSVPISVRHDTWPDERGWDDGSLIEHYVYRDLDFSRELTEADFTIQRPRRAE